MAQITAPQGQLREARRSTQRGTWPPWRHAPQIDPPAARLRWTTDRELEQEIARLVADAGRGRVVVYLPAEDAETG